MPFVYDYFLGASTPCGFAEFFNSELINSGRLKLHILKSGPGCGKSSLMRRLSARLTDAGYDIELIHCSSDPDSLDGVVCPALGFAIADGTAPHVIEPQAPAVCQSVLSLYDTIDERKLASERRKLQSLLASNASAHARASRFIYAAGSLASSVERAARAAIITDKAARSLRSFVSREFSRTPQRRGCESLRFASAVTPLGLVNYSADNMSQFENRFVIDDRCGALAHWWLAALRTELLARGYELVVCRSPLAAYEEIDAIAVPAEKLFIASSGWRSPLPPEVLKSSIRINAQRFYNKDILSASMRHIAFCRKAALELLDGAAGLLAQAKREHDAIEEIYSAAVDFDEVNRREEELCKKLGI